MPGVTEQAGAQRTEGGAGTGEPETTSEAGDAPAGTPSEPTDTSDTTDTASTSSEPAASTGGSEQAAGSGSASESESASATTTATQTRPRSADDPPPSEAPTTQHRTPDTSADAAPRGREQRTPLNVGELVWKVTAVVASLVRVVAYVIAVVLVAYILLTIVGVNPLNAIAQVVGGVADATVLAFRDLFLVADPTFAVIVNYGLAAVFWVLVAEFGSRIIRWVGARFS